MKIMSWMGPILVGVAGMALTAQADVRLANVFTNNMMFQRDQPIRIWGWAATGATVRLTLAGKEIAATAGPKGDWRADFPSMKEGENLTLTVTEQNSIVLTNLILGDIWICSGQSNMQWPLRMSLDSTGDIQSAVFPKIRMIKIKYVASAHPEENIAA